MHKYYNKHGTLPWKRHEDYIRVAPVSHCNMMEGGLPEMDLKVLTSDVSECGLSYIPGRTWDVSMCVVWIPMQLDSADYSSLHPPVFFLQTKLFKAQTKSVLCSKFPKTSTVSEQFHVFKTRIIAELTVCCKIHKDFFFIERRYFIKTQYIFELII